MSRAGRPWTTKETFELLHHKAKGYGRAQLAEVMHRSMQAIDAKLLSLQMTTEQRRRKLEHDATRRRELYRSNVPARNDHSLYSKPNVEAVEAMHRRRETKPRDLTAQFCGDPLPGYSMLERRRDEVIAKYRVSAVKV